MNAWIVCAFITALAALPPCSLIKNVGAINFERCRTEKAFCAARLWKMLSQIVFIEFAEWKAFDRQKRTWNPFASGKQNLICMLLNFVLFYAKCLLDKMSKCTDNITLIFSQGFLSDRWRHLQLVHDQLQVFLLDLDLLKFGLLG